MKIDLKRLSDSRLPTGPVIHPTGIRTIGTSNSDIYIGRIFYVPIGGGIERLDNPKE